MTNFIKCQSIEYNDTKKEFIEENKRRVLNIARVLSNINKHVFDAKI